MKHEYSAGGVVYKRENGKIWWLLGKHSGYHKWVLPKGLIEMGESAEVAAAREVEEETGVVARVIKDEVLHIENYEYQADFSEKGIGSGGIERRVERYAESGGKQEWVKKEVKFFLMEYVGGDTNRHSFEMEEVGWFEFDEALKKLEFKGEKEALKKANEEVE